MTSTPVSYDVVKVDELDLIDRVLNGNDEIIVNDLLEAPTETKRCRVIDLANSVKQYVLSIATATELGGIKVGEGLSIDPVTGVLSCGVNVISDLSDVVITDLQENQIIVYNGTQWTNVNVDQAFVEMEAGDAIEITGKGTNTVTINVKTGQGLTIVNDSVTANLGLGVRIINNKIQADIAAPLLFNGNSITLNTTNPIYFSPGGGVSLLVGSGLVINSDTGELEIDYGVIPEIDGTGYLNVTGIRSIDGSFSTLKASNYVRSNYNFSISDVNSNTNLEVIENPLDIIEGFEGVTYDRTDGNGVAAGVKVPLPSSTRASLYSNELQASLINTDNSLNYNAIIAVLVESIKELSNEIELLKNPE